MTYIRDIKYLRTDDTSTSDTCDDTFELVLPFIRDVPVAFITVDNSVTDEFVVLVTGVVTVTLLALVELVVLLLAPVKIAMHIT